MKPDLLNNKDLLAGVAFILVGGLAIAIAADYPMGSAMRMGPGYFPTALGGILSLIGVYVMLRGLRSGVTVQGAWGAKPLALIALSIVLFGLLMERVGMIPATVVTLFVAALAGRDFRVKEVLVLAIVMSAFAAGVFIYGLKLPYPLVGGH